MPVSTPHQDYIKALPKWTRARDAFEGEDAVKAKEQTYLPLLDGQDTKGYKKYRDRATFVEAPKRTVHGLAGAVLRKEPAVKYTGDEGELKSIGKGDEEFGAIVKHLLHEDIGIGRIGYLLDAPPENEGSAEPFLVEYCAEAIINWAWGRDGRGKKVPTMYVLRETEMRSKPNDEFVLEEQISYRVLRLGFVDESKLPADEEMRPTILPGDGTEPYYYQEVWVKRGDSMAQTLRSEEKMSEWILERVFVPRRKGGKPWREIPFVVVNTTTNGPEIESGPLEGVISLAFGHYRNSADYENGLHFVALPTPYGAGFSLPDGMEKMPLGGVAWLSDDPQANAGFIEFSGAGLGAILEAMTHKETKMAVLGARLLEEQRPGVEASETVKLRQTGEQSALADIADSVGMGATKLLQLIQMYHGQDNVDGISYQMNKDLLTTSIAPEMMAQLVAALTAGFMSYDTFYYNIQRGELTPDGWTMEDEIAAIEKGGPSTTNDDTTGTKTTGPGGADDHSHTYADGDTQTSEDHGHRHKVTRNEDGSVKIEPATNPETGESHGHSAV